MTQSSFYRRLRYFILPLFIGLVACQPAILNPPRIATEEARAAGDVPPTVTPLVLNAPTPTGEPIAQPVQPIMEMTPNPVLTLWVNETSAPHREVLDAMAAEFNDLHGIHLEYVLINDARLLDLVETAAISNTLPDLILHPVQYTGGWVDQAILSPETAEAVVDQLGRETFDASALSLATTAEGNLGAIPSDGWQQLWIYRSDWFEQLNQQPPDNYADLFDAAAAVYRSEDISAQTGVSTTLISGIVVPTESDLPTTQYVFEQLATANGCELVDNKGEITFIHPNCLDALDFYRELINNYSPSDVQTDVSAINAYLAGRTGIIAGSPSILPILAGLNPNFPLTCAQCQTDPNFLTANTGILTTMNGRSPNAKPTSFGQVTNLGITRIANQERAALFADYWFNDGYLKWLQVEPERKVPMRLGTAAEPTLYRQTWLTLPMVGGGQALADIYGAEVAEQIATGITETGRWGFTQGQGKLVTDVYRKFIFPIILQEMLSGYFTTSQAVIETYNRVVALIPNYAYYTEPSPTAVPTDG